MESVEDDMAGEAVVGAAVANTGVAKGAVQVNTMTVAEDVAEAVAQANTRTKAKGVAEAEAVVEDTLAGLRSTPAWDGRSRGQGHGPYRESSSGTRQTRRSRLVGEPIAAVIRTLAKRNCARRICLTGLSA